MPSISPMFRPLLLISIALQAVLASAQAPRQDLFPGVTATKTGTPFPGIIPLPMGTTALAAQPTVLALQHLDSTQMSSADYEVVSNLSAELSKQAALANFDISKPAWHFQQIVCPAFPDYIFLAFSHGADESGSSRFGAVLPRNDSRVRIITAFGHGLRPFQASWNRPGTFEVFNGLLREERGKTPLSYAPNWLMISLCYAELSGYPVQVLNTFPLPDQTMDLLRLDANQPQMMIGADQSAQVTFSDVSRPTITTNWMLHFDHYGQITSASQSQVRQPSTIALKP
ncbi:MAG TPA: hypothetical protein VN828_25170 [Acidobacteriaceae bacterium]|nr:hypothetical protein [Acidobacteriaceae bacterium]